MSPGRKSVMFAFTPRFSIFGRKTIGQVWPEGRPTDLRDSGDITPEGPSRNTSSEFDSLVRRTVTIGDTQRISDIVSECSDDLSADEWVTFDLDAVQEEAVHLVRLQFTKSTILFFANIQFVGAVNLYQVRASVARDSIRFPRSHTDQTDRSGLTNRSSSSKTRKTNSYRSKMGREE